MDGLGGLGESGVEGTSLLSVTIVSAIIGRRESTNGARIAAGSDTTESINTVLARAECVQDTHHRC